MNALTEFLFPAPAKRKASAIFGWWERRRLAYNAIVGTAGVTSLTIASVLAWLPPMSDPIDLMIMWRPILVVGALANLFYLLGPTFEIAIDKLFGREILPTGPVLYRMGLTFSVGLMFLPAMMSVVYWVARIVMTVF